MNEAYRTAQAFRVLRQDRRYSGGTTDLGREFQVCRVSLESVLESDLLAVERRLREFGARCGWVERQSRLVVVEAGDWPEAPVDFDGIVAGELAGAEAGLLIRQVTDGWRLTRISDRPDAGGDCLSQDLELAGVDSLPASGQPFGRWLRYRVYWRHDQGRGWQPFAARLLEFRAEPEAGGCYPVAPGRRRG